MAPKTKVNEPDDQEAFTQKARGDSDKKLASQPKQAVKTAPASSPAEKVAEGQEKTAPASGPVEKVTEGQEKTAPASSSAEKAAEGQEKTAPAAPSKPARKSIPPSKAHVLVVEDNVPNFVLVARMLAYMGVQRCEWKTSGWQVVEFADTLPRIDLILMDIRLPYKDGFEALDEIRENERFKDTLIVAVTAEASVEQMERAREAGFDGFLGKPLDLDRFPEQIKRVLAGEGVWELH